MTILAYHRFGGRTNVSVDLPTAQAADQFDLIKECTRVLSLDDAVEHLVAPVVDAPERPRLVLTADDGTADWVEVLLPMLVDRQLPMTWYVATAFVDDHTAFPYGGTPISWAGLAEAISTGLITVGSHTHSHAVMTRLNGTDAASEVDRSIKLIEDRLGQSCRHFAYPKALVPSPGADREVRRRFATAALAGNRVNVPGLTDPGRLGRTPVKKSDSTARFLRRVNGGTRLEGWAREHVDAFRHRRSTT